MSFKLKESWGDHEIHNFDKTKHQFLEYFEKLFNCKNLSQAHLLSQDYLKNRDNLQDGLLSDKETDLHKLFYQNIKKDETFKKLYCEFIKDIYAHFFPNEEVLIFQSYPSIRIQHFHSVVIPPHCDSDETGKHPLGEKNFLIPLTDMYGTNTIFLESKPGLGDYKGVDLKYGEVLYFNGNKCIHFNKENKEENIRISLDFRVILYEDYKNYICSESITYTNPREQNRKPTKMVLGGYYQFCFKNRIENILDWTNQCETILQSRPNFDQKEAESCYNYMKDTNNFVTEYKKTSLLEKKISEFTGAKYCTMTTSGTSALLCSLIAFSLKPGDEVIVPNYTMIATINVVKSLGAIPVIVDVNENTFTLDLKTVKKNINENTKGIIHVSLNNRVADLEDIVDFCKNNNLFLLEDTAQSLGVFYKNKHLGRYGNIGCFSLSTPKIISTGQGGFIITDDEKLFRKIISIKNFGRTEAGDDVYNNFGLNFKFTDIQAVIGLEQMDKLTHRISRMREIFDIYYNELKDINGILIKNTPFKGWIPWFIEIIILDKNLKNKYVNKEFLNLFKTPLEKGQYDIIYNIIVYCGSVYAQLMKYFEKRYDVIKEKYETVIMLQVNTV